MPPSYSLLTAGGTTIYLSGTLHPDYSGSSTPWTSLTTTPFELSMDNGGYIPQAAPFQAVFAGGPPFAPGQSLLQQQAENVTEALIINAHATNHDNAVALIHLLRKELNSAAAGLVPCVLQVQPDGSTNILYFEILRADVQELPQFVNNEKRANMARIQISWVRSPFGGRLSTGESIFSSTTFENDGTGSPDNTESLGTLSGDMAAMGGSPLNLQIGYVSGDRAIAMYMATVHSRAYDAGGSGTKVVTPSFSGVGSSSVFDVSAALTRPGLRARVLIHFSALPTAAEFRLQYYLGGSTGNAQYTNTVTLTSAGIYESGTVSSYMLDFGPIRLDAIRRTRGATAPTLYAALEARNAGGGTVTTVFMECLLYYTFGLAIARTRSGSSAGFILTNRALIVDSFAEQTNAPCLPHAPRAVEFDTANNYARSVTALRGEAPRAITGASLWLAWINYATGTTTVSRTLTNQVSVTATHAPLWLTLRGND